MFHKTFALLLAFAISASAAAITVDTSDRGYYYSYDFSDATNKNYITGQINVGASTVYFHSFFAFNALTGLTGPIVGATLNLYNPVAGYSSSQPSETLDIDGFSGNVAQLEAGGTVPGEYAALAAGPLYGTRSVSPADDNSALSILLDSAAIAFLNANSGNPFAFGGYLSGIPASDTSTRFVFGGSAFVIANDGNTTLTVVTGPASVPEPQTLFLAASGLLGVLIPRKFRRA